MQLADKDFELFRDYIYNLCGIYFHTGKKYFLESRLARRLEGCGLTSHSDYYRLLKSGPNGSQELKKLLDEITTNETCFFRNIPQLNAMETKLLPEIVAAKGKIGFRKLRIWSAASSSGEEAYTMAMMLMEKRATILTNWIIEIIGTDINETVLTQAREGVYNGYSVRNTPDYYLKKYFKQESPERYLLSPDLKKMVTFNT